MARSEFAEQMGELLDIPRLPTYVGEVESRLDDIVADKSVLRPPIEDALGSIGKRQRPILVIAAGMINGKAFNDRISYAAAAVEAVHLSSLAHDDIMDEADTRHGQESINSRYGSAVALMSGDALLAGSYGLAAKVGVEAVEELSNTVIQMVEGQTEETEQRFDIDRTVDQYKQVAYKKTARLMAAACRLGGMAAGLRPIQIEALGRYGEALGMSYQLIDDVLDLTSTSELMGKDAGNDFKQGIYTMPVLVTLKGEYAHQIRPWLGKRPARIPKGEDITRVLIEVGAIDKTIAEARRYNEKAASALADLPGNRVVKGLMKLPDVITDSLLQKRVELPSIAD